MLEASRPFPSLGGRPTVFGSPAWPRASTLGQNLGTTGHEPPLDGSVVRTNEPPWRFRKGPLRLAHRDHACRRTREGERGGPVNLAACIAHYGFSDTRPPFFRSVVRPTSSVRLGLRRIPRRGVPAPSAFWGSVRFGESPVAYRTRTNGLSCHQVPDATSAKHVRRRPCYARIVAFIASNW